MSGRALTTSCQRRDTKHQPPVVVSPQAEKRGIRTLNLPAHHQLPKEGLECSASGSGVTNSCSRRDTKAQPPRLPTAVAEGMRTLTIPAHNHQLPKEGCGRSISRGGRRQKNGKHTHSLCGGRLHTHTVEAYAVTSYVKLTSGMVDAATRMGSISLRLWLPQEG